MLEINNGSEMTVCLTPPHFPCVYYVSVHLVRYCTQNAHTHCAQLRNVQSVFINVECYFSKGPPRLFSWGSSDETHLPKYSY